jgi:hypothetical protein
MWRPLPIVVVLAPLVVGVGSYRGWFNRSPVRCTNDEPAIVGVHIDREKLRNNAESLQERRREFADRIAIHGGVATEEFTLRGTVVEVVPELRLIIVRLPDDRLRTFDVGENATVRLDQAAATLEAIKCDDRVKIAYQVERGKNRVRAVMAERDPRSSLADALWEYDTDRKGEGV